jgi:hypothetical protein
LTEPSALVPFERAGLPRLELKLPLDATGSRSSDETTLRAQRIVLCGAAKI